MVSGSAAPIVHAGISMLVVGDFSRYHHLMPCEFKSALQTKGHLVSMPDSEHALGYLQRLDYSGERLPVVALLPSLTVLERMLLYRRLHDSFPYTLVVEVYPERYVLTQHAEDDGRHYRRVTTRHTDVLMMLSKLMEEAMDAITVEIETTPTVEKPVLPNP